MSCESHHSTDDFARVRKLEDIILPGHPGSQQGADPREFDLRELQHRRHSVEQIDKHASLVNVDQIFRAQQLGELVPLKSVHRNSFGGSIRH